MKRKLIVIAATVLALGATAARADNNYVFDDPYWKQQESTRAVQPTVAPEAEGKYDLVDKYIN
jgi:hypothetical protein